jgi:hypothetical protein
MTPQTVNAYNNPMRNETFLQRYRCPVFRCAPTTR